MPKALTDAIIFTGEAMVEGHALLLDGDKIIDIVAQHALPATTQKISCGDKILAPGFIDAQVNGGGNILFNEKPTADNCIKIAEAHRKFGTTSILPTVITDAPDITTRAIAAAQEAHKQNPAILGIHIEGPHLGLERRGAHKADLIRGMSEDDLRLYQRTGDAIMLMTVAPECVPAAQIKKLRDQGVIVALGHTNAEGKDVRAALKAGASGFTHLFNGMGGLYARDTGPATIALDDPASWCSIIADGHHVMPEMIRLALHAKPPGKIFLISDAMPPAAADIPAAFELYGGPIRVEDGRCVNREGNLAGASITLLDAVRYCVNKVGIDLVEALRMASLYPASFLGLDKTLGKLLPGYAADLMAVTPALEVHKVWVRGHAVL